MFDIDAVGIFELIYMNVRVPKRGREQRVEMLKDASSRRGLFFPQVGEVLTVNYSPGLQEIWKKTDAEREASKVRVKAVVPRSDSASTAALVAVKVS